ncbi:hypothetical protein A2631_00190 [Candidatus Daviesbacteria bacterium RIFCSPHIGHO2_01_FULL_44_29]|uniref:DNA helicase UvrD n=1 Tax=Candidatus Daviesbacteria bacterium RIFCSPHIGHO2_02_FULL_43_12 TaxID=1797776 RepID=A0A1F5KI39_9BACT|nr:MAG: hypothetical protein A2631_00190 [Candidatus Daviesbacteria bacterium RIFCSPHIGHO2_01_FULL_44_29]OGE38990.1 MAG: hypothetical protein A3E86_05775 [Candidatus Daviesbacteria bacterium RIFCSPHIGHO2_12_FULL_47_45]OGE40548.1 MAG: hypothetical protein A3D25_00305 [Candidatus Daviesbacteria bacterium RIFCSPHIGHO2_02_FULL_43_12]
MAYIADLHIHSRYSRACSGELNIPSLAKWARLKGVDVLGTGDFLHPLWFAELKKDLIESATGMHTLRSPSDESKGIRFLLTTEISCIYSERGKSRRVHMLVFLPSFAAVDKLAQEFLSRKFNISSDGRPIIGISVQGLCEIVWTLEPKAIIIPAHIYTPWFSLYGSESGYDFFKECFGGFSDQILAIETGLSSEPAMNWRIADLDNKAIVSFSDAHSLPRLGREVTIFKGNLSFDELRDDLSKQNILETVEFFPEEGKYHYSGHRNCNIVYSPEELKKKGQICPVCNRRLTVGVMNRVEDLATRSQEELKLKTENGVIKSLTFPHRPGFRMLVGLEEIIAASLEVGIGSTKVRQLYMNLVSNLDTELKILTKTSTDLISMVAGARVAEGVERVRQGKLSIEPGFDNTYGQVKIWADGEPKALEQVSLL